MDVSIILVSYNTKDLTRDCIKSIYEKTQNVAYDVYRLSDDLIKFISQIEKTNRKKQVGFIFSRNN